MITLDDYLELMPSNQKNIYFYCCSDRSVIQRLSLTGTNPIRNETTSAGEPCSGCSVLQTALASPYMEQFVAKGRPVILMTSDIDEFLTMNLSVRCVVSSGLVPNIHL